MHQPGPPNLNLLNLHLQPSLISGPEMSINNDHSLLQLNSPLKKALRLIQYIATMVAAQGRGSAAVALGLTLLLCLLLHSEVADAATFTVGDSGGWSFNTVGWADGKSFRAGDVLLFRYNPSVHNVVLVSAAGYNSCSAPRGSRVLTSGNDRITLGRGTSYFICSFAGHCKSGMKIAVTAA